MSSSPKGINWDAQPLGRVADHELARRLGVTAPGVGRARARRGIPPFNPQSAAIGFERHAEPTSPETPGAKFDEERDDEVTRLVVAVRKGARTMADACDALDVGPSSIRRLLARAEAAGYPLQLAGDALLWHLPDESPEAEVRIGVSQPVGGWHTLGIIGDLHAGSKQCRHDYLDDFVRNAYARGVRAFFQVGDLLDGEYSHGKRELRAHGWDAQADEAIAILPRYTDIQYYFIDGNHDNTFSQSSGAVSGRAFVDRAHACGRKDVVFLGQRRGLIRLDSGQEYSPLVELWHPKKGPAYAASYGIQKRVEAYRPGQKPDILLVGHWHQFCYLHERGVHALSCGTFQGEGSEYSNALGSGVALGGSILSYTLTGNGTLRQVAVERVCYYERETVRAVAV